jgi:hypothetical protein
VRQAGAASFNKLKYIRFLEIKEGIKRIFDSEDLFPIVSRVRFTHNHSPSYTARRGAHTDPHRRISGDLLPGKEPGDQPLGWLISLLQIRRKWDRAYETSD